MKRSEHVVQWAAMTGDADLIGIGLDDVVGWRSTLVAMVRPVSRCERRSRSTCRPIIGSPSTVRSTLPGNRDDDIRACRIAVGHQRNRSLAPIASWPDVFEATHDHCKGEVFHGHAPPHSWSTFSGGMTVFQRKPNSSAPRRSGPQIVQMAMAASCLRTEA